MIYKSSAQSSRKSVQHLHADGRLQLLQLSNHHTVLLSSQKSKTKSLLTMLFNNQAPPTVQYTRSRTGSRPLLLRFSASPPKVLVLRFLFLAHPLHPAHLFILPQHPTGYDLTGVEDTGHGGMCAGQG